MKKYDRLNKLVQEYYKPETIQIFAVWCQEFLTFCWELLLHETTEFTKEQVNATKKRRSHKLHTKISFV